MINFAISIFFLLKLANYGLRILKLNNLIRLSPGLLEITPLIRRMKYNCSCVSRQ